MSEKISLGNVRKNEALGMSEKMRPWKCQKRWSLGNVRKNEALGMSV